MDKLGLIDSSRKLLLICADMHVISLYLILHACAATFDVMRVKKTKATKEGLNLSDNILRLRLVHKFEVLKFTVATL
jgi:hypothetical protein